MTPGWARACGLAAIACALPTVVWRVVVGLGATLGTPEVWREREQLPGSGTAYVVGLSVLQILAAAATLVLIVPGADRVPFTTRRWPIGLVVSAATLGAFALAAICVLSAANWHNVDPFGERTSTTAWTYLCWACYVAALGWPPLLLAAAIGYGRGRTRASAGAVSAGHLS